MEIRMPLGRLRSALLPLLPGAGVGAILAMVYWFPALAWHQTAIHGDIPALSVPYLDFLAHAIKGLTFPLWSDQIYGGHPFFAEGQIGFLQPMNLLWAAVVTPLVGPITSVNLYHWALMNFAAIGLLGLCRSLGASPWASAFAVVAVVFSGIWTHEQYAIPVALTLAWIPWCLWAMEEWLKRMTLQSALLFGAACAAVFHCGYPQGLHGTIIYGIASLLVVPFHAASRRDWLQNWPWRLKLGAIAVAVCIGLVAVQLLPLLELVGLSHRSDGIGLAFQDPLAAYLRGELFTKYINPPFYYKPGIGSVLVCTLASFVIVCRAPPRAIGHLIAALILFQLGIETASPLFRLVYEHHLLPGLNYFRIMHFYLGIAAIGIGVAAAFAIDGIAQWAARSRGIWSIIQPIPELSKIAGFIIMVAFWTFWIWALIKLQATHFSWLHIAVVAAASVAAAILIFARKPSLVAPVYVLCLAIECIGLRAQPFKFFDQSILATPSSVEAIKSVPDWADYKFKTVSISGLASLTSPLDPELPDRMRKLVMAIAPTTSLLSNIASLDAHTALPLMRRALIEPLLGDDIFDRSSAPPGLRLIDLLAVRFVTLDGFANIAAFRQIDFNDPLKVWTMENMAALPRFQIYTKHQVVNSLDEALKAVTTMKEKTLIVEKLDGLSETAITGDRGGAQDDAAARFEVIEARSTRYAFRTFAAKPAWLFVADANYPGWTATVDGKTVPLFSAQVLGKAVVVPPGNHEVTMRFRSRSFLWGLLISLLTLAGIAGAIWYSRRASRDDRPVTM